MMLKNIILIKLVFVCFIKSQSPEQIKIIENVVKSKGMSKQQAIDAAKAQGYTNDQIKAVEKKYNSQNRSDSKKPADQSLSPDLGISDSEQSDLLEEKKEDLIDEEKLELETKAQETSTEPSYFGYDIFKRDPSAFQSSSVGAVEPDYLIGPGDEIMVML